MPLHRRNFLQHLSAAGLVSLGGAPPAFLSRAAWAAEQPATTPTDGRILVLVQLAGGNDGLNTVIPFADEAYYKARPGIGVPRGNVLKLDDQVGLHPQLAGFKELFDEGRLRIVQGVGYPEPNRSHFRSMDIWQTARPQREDLETGWIGRLLDQAAPVSSGELGAVALGQDRLPLSLLAERVNVPTIRDLAAYELRVGTGPAQNQDLRKRLIPQLTEGQASAGSELDFLRRTARNAYRSAQQLHDVSSRYQPAIAYPGSRLSGMLKLVAQMIAGELETRIFFVSLDGFDTHSQQAGAHQALLGELSSAVTAFYRDLAGHSLQDRVVLATFSEFGRRVQENGSLGTDHGAASQMFIVAPTGKAGVRGAHPSLTDLTEGDLKFHTDFRSVYATLLTKWLGLPSQPILDGDFPMLDFV